MLLLLCVRATRNADAAHGVDPRRLEKVVLAIFLAFLAVSITVRLARFRPSLAADPRRSGAAGGVARSKDSSWSWCAVTLFGLPPT